MNKASDYPLIRLWGTRMGSTSSYVQDQQVLAVRDNAPVRAIFRQHSVGIWITVDDLPATHPFRVQFGTQTQAA